MTEERRDWRELCATIAKEEDRLREAGSGDGWSLDDKRTPLLSDDNLGCLPKMKLTPEEHAKNNLPDILARWRERAGKERERPRTTACK